MCQICDQMMKDIQNANFELPSLGFNIVSVQPVQSEQQEPEAILSQVHQAIFDVIEENGGVSNLIGETITLKNGKSEVTILFTTSESLEKYFSLEGKILADNGEFYEFMREDMEALRNSSLFAFYDGKSLITMKNRIDGKTGYMNLALFSDYAEMIMTEQAIPQVSDEDAPDEDRLVTSYEQVGACEPCEPVEYKNMAVPYNPESKYDTVMIVTASSFAQMSCCNRMKVGAVIAKEGRILITGYNGTISGMPNECEEPSTTEIKYTEIIGQSNDFIADAEKWCAANKVTMIHAEFDGVRNFITYAETKTVTSDFTVHAEQNAIFYAAKKGIALEGCTMYITHNPCKQCAKAIASAGITRVVYRDFYRDSDGVDFLQKCGVTVEQL